MVNLWWQRAVNTPVSNVASYGLDNYGVRHQVWHFSQISTIKTIPQYAYIIESNTQNSNDFCIYARRVPTALPPSCIAPVRLRGY